MPRCPGCKGYFDNGRSFSVHASRCKGMNLAESRAANLHATSSAKQADDKRKKIAMQKDLLAGRSVPVLPDDPGMLEDEVMQENVPADIRSPSPPPRPSGRPARKVRKPKRYRDEPPPLPPLAVPLEDDDPGTQEDGQPANAGPSPRDLSPSNDYAFTTEQNTYGIYREYAHGPPSITPDEHFTIASVSDSATIAREPSEHPWKSSLGLHKSQINDGNYYAPFPNPSRFLLMSWYYGSTIKSYNDADSLVHDVIRHKDFKASDFEKSYSIARDAGLMDTDKDGAAKSLPKEPSGSGSSLPFSPNDGWINGSVSIPVPCDGFNYASEDQAPHFTVDGIWYRRPLEIIKRAFTEPAAEKFHFTPFKEYWKLSDDEPAERIISEMYTADIFNEEYNRIKASIREGPNAHLEAIMAAISFYSDSMHITSFGDVSLWPIYMYIGNQSKYVRAKPSAFAAHHVAYIPKLGDNIQDFYMKTFGKVATTGMLTHLRRKLMHAIWRLLLDDDLINAYKHGEAIKLLEEIMVALFPRFLLYSADYPEKVLLSCIKFLTVCMCPRCESLKIKIPLVGSKMDMRNREKLARTDNFRDRFDLEMARKLLFKGINITSVKIERILEKKSMVPTRNAFSERLRDVDPNFNFYQLLQPDFLHEIELGVWKAIFTHLIRIFLAYGHDSIQALNQRYRQISTFGRDTIRKFTKNASGMKKLAARDFEDLLQCAIPVFEGLLPKKHDRVVQKLLFELATWHALAKLRMHTESTLGDLKNSTIRLGDAIRKFKLEVCNEYLTKELPSEEAARGRREAAKAKKKLPMATTDEPSEPPIPKAKTTKFRFFNMETYKLHAFPDYALSILLYGTVDNTSSQNIHGEAEHKHGKRFYPRVRKGDHVRGIARHIYRERTLHQAKESYKLSKNKKSNTLGIPLAEAEDLGLTPPEDHYHMSSDVRNKVDVLKWIADNQKEPALNRFLIRLKDHLLGCLLDTEEEFSVKDRLSITLVKNRIYHHKVMRINYTTYDMRRAQDSLNPRTHGDIMVLSQDDPDHPYWYARIIGIFHTMVVHRGPRSSTHEAKKMDFLFVRWLGRDSGDVGGWKAKKLHQVGFIAGDEGFGFVDPADIIRAVHLIPRFTEGHTDEFLGSSFARSPLDNNQDWVRFYVNMFVDRDMVMRFRGDGVGHISTRPATANFRSDRDPLDIKSREERHGHNMNTETSSDSGEEEHVDSEKGNDKMWESDAEVQEDVVSESELQDYGYNNPNQLEDEDYDNEEEEEEEEDEEAGDEEEEEEEEEDGDIANELDELGYAEY